MTAGLVAAEPAAAAATCSYDATTQRVTATGGGTSTTLTFKADAIQLDGIACGSATPANTSRVELDNVDAPFAYVNLQVPLGTTDVLVSRVGRTVVNYQATGNGTFTVGAGSAGTALDVDGDLIADVESTSTGFQMVGGAGNDTVRGSGGLTSPGGATYGPVTNYFGTFLFGGLGNDDLTGPGTLDPAQGDDTLTLGATGTTQVRYQAATGSVRMKPDLSGTETGFDGYGGTDTYVGFADPTKGFNVEGGFHPDVLHGSAGPNMLVANGSADTVSGAGGSDTLFGGPGSDTVRGGPGNDQVFGANDQAADGGNTLDGGPGADTIRGTASQDSYPGLQDDATDAVNCGGGGDTGLSDRSDSLNANCEGLIAPAVVSIAGAAAQLEGAALKFTVSLDRPEETTQTVAYATADGTATQPADYAPATGTVTFAPGELSKEVAVATKADPDGGEADETVTLTLSNPSAGPVLGTAAATGTIEDLAPVAIGLAPGEPAASGWFRTAPTVTVTPPAASTTRCALDSASTPATYADLPADPCAYTGAGATVAADGAHELCAASASGEAASLVVCRTWKTDATAPVVTCAATPAFTVGDAGKTVTATVADAASGPTAASASASADTAIAGARTAAVTGTDVAGNTTTVDCPYTVRAAPIFTPPVVEPPILCGRPVVLLNARRRGRKIEIQGVAAVAYAGQQVTVLAGRKRAGTATVGPDGAFAAKVKARGKAAYRAVLPDGSRSSARRANRRLLITKRAGTSASGKVTGKRSQRPKRLLVQRQDTCAAAVVQARPKVSRSGAFRITLAAPVAPAVVAVYRVKAKFKRGRAESVTLLVTG